VAVDREFVYIEWENLFPIIITITITIAITIAINLERRAVRERAPGRPGLKKH